MLQSLQYTVVQVRAFGKEAAACDRYRDAVLKMQGWGLKSAALGGLFGGFNATFTTGAWSLQEAPMMLQGGRCTLSLRPLAAAGKFMLSTISS